MKKELYNLFVLNIKKQNNNKIFAKATYYQDGNIKVYVPHEPITIKQPTAKKASKFITKNPGLEDIEAENIERSVRRSQQLIQNYVLNNEFDLFCTFTFSPKKTERQNADLVKKKMARWLKNQQVRYGKFDYLIVPELHKDKKSLHFHALFAGYKGILVDANKRINGRKSFNFKSYTLGFNSAVRIDNKNAVSSYVRKYITKDMPQFHGKHRFWATRGLKPPRIEINPDEWYVREKPLRVYENVHGRILYFNESSLATPLRSLTEDSTALSLAGESA